jgi:two-component system phosphate regulon sensor histidine kinase PhoR
LIRSRFIWRLYAGTVALILLTASLIGFFVSRNIVGQSLQDTENDLRTKALFLARVYREAVADGDLSSLQDEVRGMGEETESRLTVIGADGAVLADSDADPVRMDDHGSRAEILAARKSGIGSSTRYSDTVGREMMYVALSVRDGEEIVGYVRAAFPLVDVSRRLAHIRNVIAAIAGLSSLAALLLGFFFARRVTGPLRQMTRAAIAVAGGDYEREFEVRSRDEIGALAGAFNTMIEQLRSRMETIVLDRNKLLAILSSMVEGVVAIDRSEKILHLNLAAARILDVDREQAIGNKIAEVTGMPEVRETLARAIREEREIVLETNLGTAAGKRKIEMRASPLRDGDERLAGAVLVFSDMTELRRLEAVRRDFVANVSHELKTPVTAIRGLVETLIDDAEMPPDRKLDFLRRVHDQSMRLSSLITDLLTVSSVESREWAPEIERIDLRETARRSMRNLRALGETKGLAMETDLPAEPVFAYADADAMRQIVDNLLDNAVKYTPAGGRVRVRVRPDGARAVVEVEDNGVGIHPKYHARIFERFYRIDKARSRELGGTGLGLAIVKHLVLALGGTIDVESEEGKGSVFRARMPANAPAASSRSAPTLFEDRAG